MTRADFFIAQARAACRKSGLPDSGEHLIRMMAELHLRVLDACSPGYARAGLPFVGEPRKPEADLARPTAIDGEQP